MNDSRAMVHAALLHGVRQPSAVRDCVRAFATANASALVEGPIALFAGDEIERGQTGPDRRQDLSGSPLYLVVTPLASGAVAPLPSGLHDQLGRCSARVETWTLRERYAQVAQRGGSTDESCLQIIMMNIDASVDSEFNEWYEHERFRL